MNKKQSYLNHGGFYNKVVAAMLAPITEPEIQRIRQYPEEDAYNERLAMQDIRRESGWNNKAVDEVKYELEF